jgi:uncharacterized protein
MNKTFSLLIKPASADCNLRCDYFFYLDRAGLYPETRVHRMTDNVLARLIATYMATGQAQYVFGWQGGEPLLMGIDFYRRVVELQSRCGRAGAMVANGIQTNATLITDELAALFAKYRFLVGVSLDGPEAVHDAYRRNGNGAGSYAAVMRGIDRLKQHGVEFNILTLVTRANAQRARETYQFLREQGFLHHQYIPCVELDETGNLQPYAVGADEWGQFLVDIYDAWIRNDAHTVSIRLFDSIVVKLVEGRATICHMEPDCCQYLVVEHNGDVYPCDFFVANQWKLGNINGHSWDQIRSAPLYLRFGGQKSDLAAECAECKWRTLCAGDCLKHRQADGQGARNISRLCEGWKRFFAHSFDGFQRLAEAVKSERERTR